MKYRLRSIVVKTQRKCIVVVVYNVKTHFRYNINISLNNIQESEIRGQ